jgi:hypothetical protein
MNSSTLLQQQCSISVTPSTRVPIAPAAIRPAAIATEKSSSENPPSDLL